MSLLSDKVAVVTGVSSGIGWSIGKFFPEGGARVFVVSRRERPPLESEPHRSAFTFVRGDVSEQMTLQEVAAGITRQYGRLDILVNNAAILHPGGFLEALTD